MSEASPPDLTIPRVVLELRGMDAVTVRRDVPYRSNTEGPGMDVYTPPGEHATPLPAIVFITGYPDAGFKQVAGCKLKEMGQYISWARLLAAFGFAAITYENLDPVADARTVLEFVRRNAADLDIDEHRIGIWSCSGNVPNALSLLFDHAQSINCAVLYYGYMLDLEGSTEVADAAANFYFANPCSGRSLDDMPADLPLQVVRAGLDETPNLNRSIARFAGGALDRNLPITLINHANAPHAFDVSDDSEDTRAVIKATLAFLRAQLIN